VASLLALLASFSNALSAIFQRIGVQSAPADSTMSLSLIAHALKRWIWLVGVGLILAGFVLQAVALRFGQLSAVQPIVTTELLFLVLILGIWFRYRVAARDWLGALAAGGGLAAFLLIAAPAGGDTVPSLRHWATAFVVLGAAVVGGVALGFVGPRWFRAAMFGTAAGLMFALAAALTKVFTTLVTEGWGHVFDHWEPYALVATGLFGFFLSQSAYHAGPITASQATLTIVDPLVSVAIGIWLFGDRLQSGGWRLPAEVVAMTTMFTGVLVLSLSPLVAGAKDESGGGERLERQRRRPS
jgi:drug/metabolite transporter (DMT)-like permease